MKNPPKNSAVIAAIFCAAGIAGTILSQAQEITVRAAPSADSIVALAADSQSLLQVAPSSVPVRGGTFWWVYPGGQAIPTPMLPPGSSGPIYGIKPGEFLVDLTGGTVMVTPRQLAAAGQTANPYAAAVTDQVQGLMNLITFVQTPPTATTASAMTLSAKPMGGGGGFSPDDLTQPGGYPYLTIAPSGTNQLLISVIDTNASTYYLQMTPVLANTNYPFAIIANGVAGQTNFTVNIGPFDDEFFRVLVDTNNPGAGIAVFIDSPANGASVQ